VATAPDRPEAATYRDMASKVWAALAEGTVDRRPPPRIIIE
jgi:hypothetical protein